MWCLETIKAINQKAGHMPINQAMAECGIRVPSREGVTLLAEANRKREEEKAKEPVKH